MTPRTEAGKFLQAGLEALGFAADDAAERIVAIEIEAAARLRDPHLPQWEDCKVCGGDHWTKDHRPVPTVCEVCGKLADGQPGRCHLHFRMSQPPADQGLAALAEWPCQKYNPPHDCGRVTGNAPLPCGPCTARAARLSQPTQPEKTR